MLLEQLLSQEDGILYLYKCTKSALVIFNEVLISNLSDVCMDSRHRYVVADSDVAGGISAYLQILLVLRIQYEEHLGLGELFLLIA